MPSRKTATTAPEAVVTGKTLRTIRATKKSGGLYVDVFDTKGKVVDSIELPKEIFGVKTNKQLLAQAVRVYLANQRRGSASTKTRGEVHGSSRKIYRQKGTGRARHGTIRAPIFVHGGIVFGPKPRDFSLKLTKQMRRKALACALSARLSDKEIKVVLGLEKLEPKTKIMADAIKNLGIDKKPTLLILPSYTSKNILEYENVLKSARNIEGVTIRPVSQLNTYEVLQNKHLLFLKSAIASLGKTIGGDS